MFECPDCGSEHESQTGLKIHYGRSHEGSIAGEPVECDVCGTQFRKQWAEIEKHDRSFCSAECKSKAYQNRVTLICDNCGDEFSRRASHHNESANQFCSISCRDQHRKTRHSVECENCGEVTEKTDYKYRNADIHFCSIECRDEYQQGENHPSWTSGAWLLKTLRRHVGDFRWRDRYEHLDAEDPLRCVMCGVTEEEIDRELLDTHHIVPVMAGGSNSPDNLMILCRSCHRTADSFVKSRIEYPLADALPAAE